MKPRILAMICTATLGFGAAAFAADVEARIQGGSLSFAGGHTFTNANLMVIGPQGFQAEETQSRGLPVFRIQGAGRMVDGLYQYNLSAASDEKIPVGNTLNNGRGPDAPKTEMRPFNLSGTFRIEKGVIIPAEDAASGGDGDATE